MNPIPSPMNQETCGCHCWFGNMLVFFCVAWWLDLFSRKEEDVGNRNGGNTGVVSKNIQNTPRKGHTVLFLWASGIQRLGPFAALIKPLFWKMFFLELNPDHYGVLFSPLFSLGIELVFKPCPCPKCKIWSTDNMVKIFCHSQHICTQYSQPFHDFNKCFF